MQLSRDNSELQTHLEDNDEDAAELMKKYKAVVAQVRHSKERRGRYSDRAH